MKLVFIINVRVFKYIENDLTTQIEKVEWRS